MSNNQTLCARVTDSMLKEVDEEAAKHGMNRSEYLILLLERRNTSALNTRLAMDNEEMKGKLNHLIPRYQALQDRWNNIEHGILGASLRKALGKSVRIEDTEEVIVVRSIEDYITVLDKITKLTEDDGDTED